MTGERMQGWAVALLATSLLLAACDTVGPAAIRNGRAAYSEAIASTTSQQVFSVIVRARFQEPVGLLAVSSVNASIRVTGEVGANVGIGPESGYAGNLVPFSAGATYEESPTISYAPVQGVDYLSELFGPLPLALALLSIQAEWDAGLALTVLVKSINGIRNPAYLIPGEPAPDTRFERIAGLISMLHRSERLALATNDEGKFALTLPGGDASVYEQIAELHRLLSLPVPEAGEPVHDIPVVLGTGKGSEPVVRIELRSLAELIKIAGAAMAVPPEQVEAGFATKTPKLGAIGKYVRIEASPEPPASARVAEEVHDFWYYIPLTDQQSKQFFSLFERLLSARIADSVRRGNTAPILTLPVVK